jgi:Type II secretion system (T2SS), protein M subtype b
MNAAARWAERCGAAGLAGLLALVAAGTVFLALGLPLLQQRAQLQQHLQQLGQTPRAAAPRQDDSDAAQLTRFYAAFPPAGAAAESLGRVQAAARRAGIVLPSGEYRLEQRSGERLQRYTAVLPVRGSYAQIRAFIDGLLSELPHAAIDDIELRREDAASAELEARLRLTLYLRAAP